MAVLGEAHNLATLFEQIGDEAPRTVDGQRAREWHFERYDVGRHGLTSVTDRVGGSPPLGLTAADAVVLVLDSATFPFLGLEPGRTVAGSATPAELVELTADGLGPDVATRPVAVVLTRTDAISRAVPYEYHFELDPPSSPEARRSHARRVDAELRWVVANWVDDERLRTAIARFGRVTLHPSASPPTVQEFLSIVGSVVDRRSRRPD